MLQLFLFNCSAADNSELGVHCITSAIWMSCCPGRISQNGKRLHLWKNTRTVSCQHGYHSYRHSAVTWDLYPLKSYFATHFCITTAVNNAFSFFIHINLTQHACVFWYWYPYSSADWLSLRYKRTERLYLSVTEQWQQKKKNKETSFSTLGHCLEHSSSGLK